MSLCARFEAFRLSRRREPVDQCVSASLRREVTFDVLAPQTARSSQTFDKEFGSRPKSGANWQFCKDSMCCPCKLILAQEGCEILASFLTWNFELSGR